MFPDVPTCKEEKEELYGALKQETVALKCQVDANPPLVTFKWTFNNSGEQTDVPPSRYILYFPYFILLFIYLEVTGG